MDQTIKIVALALFLLFMLLQFKFGIKSKIIAYFFFIIAAVLYVRDYNISLWLQFIIIGAILLIVLSSLYYEVNNKRLAEENNNASKQKTFADRQRKNKK
ncbi:hypothetical protein [Kurthia sibirica]|uniref:Uncharacterized protein n=1 Tax=Kurthia sibirica TaxID=202750 RepID=A0A2U3AN88_9BACL|nr:hypothetical protein [Kurthia sibirica]PWI25981.1 hypothetical protein DEX24_05470 [Kurthia sibirica]GEK34986.1 hypothetical protein KSI01_25190 [Kurthia sibirica]